MLSALYRYLATSNHVPLFTWAMVSDGTCWLITNRRPDTAFMYA